MYATSNETLDGKQHNSTSAAPIIQLLPLRDNKIKMKASKIGDVRFAPSKRRRQAIA